MQAPLIVKQGKPLDIPETPSQYPFTLARQVSSTYTAPRQFVNRADRPLTERQTARLHRKHYGGQYHKNIQEEVKRLLEASAGVGQQVLAHLRGQAEPQAEPSLPDVPPPGPPPPMPPPARVVKREQDPADEKEVAPEGKPKSKKFKKVAQADLDELTTKYPGMTRDEQKALLAKIRKRYKAKKMANVNVLKQMIEKSMEES
jgi:hypothetical protein